MKNGKKFLKSLKKNIDADIHKVTDKTGAIAKFSLEGVKKEGEDVKKALEKKDLIYLKTDALAVVLRKLGGLDEFLAVFEKLTKEGYLLVWTEPVTSILPMGFRLAGNFYYFQKGKLIA
ncbi:MAG: hypothetical protein ACREAU_02595 [Nitrosopumilaceae archaeon]